MYKRLLFTFALLLSLVVSPLAAPSAKAVVTNTLIKIDSSSTVYWYAADGRRYVFPNPRTFYSWFTDADLGRVLTISPQEMGSIAIGGNVTYRPGVRLIKITTDPRVYAVSRYGVLRWITSEALARQLYGDNWALMVDDVPDEFFTNYRTGDAVYTASQFDRAFETGQARSPSDNIGNNNNTAWPNPPAGGLSGQVNFSVSNSQPSIGETITLSANGSNVSAAAQYLTISLINASTGQTLRSCVGILPCTFNIYIDSTPSNGSYQTYYARVTHSNGQYLNSSNITVYVRGTNNQNDWYPATSNVVTFDRSSVRPGDSFTVTANLSPVTNVAPYYTIRIYDQWNILQHTCERVRTCVLQQTLSQTSDISRSYYAVATSDHGQRLESGNATISVIQSSPTFGRLGSTTLVMGLYAPTSVATSPEYTIYSGRELTVSANMDHTPSNIYGMTIKIYQQDGTLVQTCNDSATCSVKKILTNTGNSDLTTGFYARVQDSYGAWYTSPTIRVIVRRDGTISGTVGVGISHSSIGSNQIFRVNAGVSGSNVSDANLNIAWYQSSNDALMSSCESVNPCIVSTSYPALAGQPQTMSFYAKAWDKSGSYNGQLTSLPVTITITP